MKNTKIYKKGGINRDFNNKNNIDDTKTQKKDIKTKENVKSNQKGEHGNIQNLEKINEKSIKINDFIKEKNIHKDVEKIKNSNKLIELFGKRKTTNKNLSKRLHLLKQIKVILEINLLKQLLN